MPSPVRGLLLVLSCLFALAACQFGGSRKDDDLRGYLFRYESTVRWDDLRKAYNYLKPGLEVQIPSDLANIRVTSYETVSPPVPGGDGQWMQTVSIQYLHRDRQQVKTLVDRQIWSQDPETELWYRVNPIPAFP